MSEKELFEEVLKYFEEQYHLEIEHPYNDSYMVIKKDGREVGNMNSSGYNLLRNLNELTNMLKSELL